MSGIFRGWSNFFFKSPRWLYQDSNFNVKQGNQILNLTRSYKKHYDESKLNFSKDEIPCFRWDLSWGDFDIMSPASNVIWWPLKDLAIASMEYTCKAILWYDPEILRNSYAKHRRTVLNLSYCLDCDSVSYLIDLWRTMIFQSWPFSHGTNFLEVYFQNIDPSVITL